MLQVEPLRSLLEDKWDRFASKLFWLNFLFYLIYLAIFTTVAVYRKEGQVGEKTALILKTRKLYFNIFFNI